MSSTKLHAWLDLSPYLLSLSTMDMFSFVVTVHHSWHSHPPTQSTCRVESCGLFHMREFGLILIWWVFCSVTKSPSGGLLQYSPFWHAQPYQYEGMQESAGITAKNGFWKPNSLDREEQVHKWGKEDDYNNWLWVDLIIERIVNWTGFLYCPGILCCCLALTAAINFCCRKVITLRGLPRNPLRNLSTHSVDVIL